MDCVLPTAEEGYHEVQVDEHTSRLVGVKSRSGNYVFRVLCLGSTPSLAESYSRIRDLLEPLSHSVCVCVDDESRVAVLKQLFKLLDSVHLKIRREKCQFQLEEVRYLGFIVKSHGISIDDSRFETIRATSRPIRSSEVRPFFCLLQLLHRFLPNVADACMGLNKISGDTFY